MSDTMRWFVGGQQELMPELLAMVACTVNSYTRLIPGYWAPTDATWGVENRTTALRVIPGSEKSQRVEYRVSAADINPYIALAAAIGSGLWGVENRVDPGAPVKGNAYAVKHPRKRALPRSLGEAAERFRASKPPAACSATSSSTTTQQPGSGRIANRAKRSPTGSSRAISRSSEGALGT
jgi:glutamine synthetase